MRSVTRRTCGSTATAPSSCGCEFRQLNNCTYCLNLHYEAAREAGIPRAKIDTLTAWWETELHSEAEQAALRYTEALTRSAHTDRDAAFQRFTTRSSKISAWRRSLRSSASWST